MDAWSDFFDWSPAGGSGRIFGRKIWNCPWLRESEGFLVGNVNVRRSVKQMEMWSGDPKEDVT